MKSRLIIKALVLSCGPTEEEAMLMKKHATEELALWSPSGQPGRRAIRPPLKKAHYFLALDRRVSHLLGRGAAHPEHECVKNGAKKNSSTTASPRSNATITPPPEEPQLPRTKLSEEDNNEDAEKEALCHMHDLGMITGNELLPERGALPLSPRLEGVDPPASKARVLPSHSTTT
jgi:hypothetical protein